MSESAEQQERQIIDLENDETLTIEEVASINADVIDALVKRITVDGPKASAALRAVADKGVGIRTKASYDEIVRAQGGPAAIRETVAVLQRLIAPTRALTITMVGVYRDHAGSVLAVAKHEETEKKEIDLALEKMTHALLEELEALTLKTMSEIRSASEPLPAPAPSPAPEAIHGC